MVSTVCLTRRRVSGGCTPHLLPYTERLWRYSVGDFTVYSIV